ncbi:hypothetical protein MTO96_048460 [Rhipicephalus appendiculatus]
MCEAMKRTETRDGSSSSLVLQSRLTFFLALLVVSNVKSPGDTAAGRGHDEEEAAADQLLRETFPGARVEKEAATATTPLRARISK